MIPKRQKKKTKELQLTAGRKFLMQEWVSKAEARSVPQTEEMGFGVHWSPRHLGFTGKHIIEERNAEREFWRSADNLFEYSAENW